MAGTATTSTMLNHSSGSAATGVRLSHTPPNSTNSENTNSTRVSPVDRKPIIDNGSSSVVNLVPFSSSCAELQESKWQQHMHNMYGMTLQHQQLQRPEVPF
ncbi:hypothetical protein CHUAL_001600 [Chamberlinius hualienensis]